LARESEFIPLNDAELRAVVGPNSRHVALIEDAFKVLVEAPGGGVSVNGGVRDRGDARRVIEDLA
jgi:phosphate starvation-inducible PhoH-like protein